MHGSRFSASGFRRHSIRLTHLGQLATRRCQLGSQILKQHLLLPSQESQLEPPEDVVHDRLRISDIRITRPSAWLEPGMGELLAEQLQGHTVLQGDRHGEREAIDESANCAAFFRHGDEQFAGLPVGIETDGDVSLMVANFELVGDGSALFLQLMPHSPRRSIQIFFLYRLCGGGRIRSPRSLSRLGSRCRQRLRLLAPVPINSHSLQTKLPSLKISLHDVLHGSALRQIDSLRYCPGDKRLSSRHHPEMPHVMNRPSPLSRLERAVENSKVIVLDMRRPLDRSRSINVADDRICLLMHITKLEQRSRHSVVDNLNHPPAHKLLILNKRKIRLHPCGVAVHHEAYGSRGGQDCYLGISVSVFFAVT